MDAGMPWGLRAALYAAVVWGVGDRLIRTIAVADGEGGALSEEFEQPPNNKRRLHCSGLPFLRHPRHPTRAQTENVPYIAVPMQVRSSGWAIVVTYAS